MTLIVREATACLKALKEDNSTLTRLNLERNADISTERLETANNMLASRRVLLFLHQPLEERVVQFVVQAMQRCSVHAEARLALFTI
jgi:hypothetical protein